MLAQFEGAVGLARLLLRRIGPVILLHPRRVRGRALLARRAAPGQLVEDLPDTVGRMEVGDRLAAQRRRRDDLLAVVDAAVDHRPPHLPALGPLVDAHQPEEVAPLKDQGFVDAIVDQRRQEDGADRQPEAQRPQRQRQRQDHHDHHQVGALERDAEHDAFVHPVGIREVEGAEQEVSEHAEGGRHGEVERHLRQVRRRHQAAQPAQYRLALARAGDAGAVGRHAQTEQQPVDGQLDGIAGTARPLGTAPSVMSCTMYGRSRQATTIASGYSRIP